MFEHLSKTRCPTLPWLQAKSSFQTSPSGTSSGLPSGGFPLLALGRRHPSCSLPTGSLEENAQCMCQRRLSASQCAMVPLLQCTRVPAVCGWWEAWDLLLSLGRDVPQNLYALGISTKHHQKGAKPCTSSSTLTRAEARAMGIHIEVSSSPGTFASRGKLAPPGPPAAYAA